MLIQEVLFIQFRLMLVRVLGFRCENNLLFFFSEILGDDNGTLVTASHAIFKEDGVRKAPVAVVGFQFKHTALYDIFNSITNKVST